MKLPRDLAAQTARAKGGGDPRAAEYVDSPSMRMRIRDGRRLVVRIDGRYGFYRAELDLAAPNASSCSCPSEESPCKHVRALRKTWRVNPRSFLEAAVIHDTLALPLSGAADHRVTASSWSPSRE